MPGIFAAQVIVSGNTAVVIPSETGMLEVELALIVNRYRTNSHSKIQFGLSNETSSGSQRRAIISAFPWVRGRWWQNENFILPPCYGPGDTSIIVEMAEVGWRAGWGSLFESPGLLRQQLEPMTT